MSQQHGYLPQPVMHMHQAPPPQEGEWESSLMNCSPCDSCCLSLCCPCILMGKTTARLEDPSLRDYGCVNPDCLIMTGITFLGFGFIYITIKRMELRKRFGIAGSGLGDCCVSCWCSCCAVIQHDNEARKRLGEPGKDGHLVQQGYQQNPGMVMPK
ncbi:hypothetical protein MCOR27_011161 [Pyricularia oryzae]|uniref:DUF614 domain-containing protein n=4 Tax=Pyricularia oryzae TaxID=318829 RepID=G4MU38_PYRO7|nr:uncharacterized protein MGG_07227 [Pyricularia oryzae 70-15]ELQ39547.1 hypothetical protein OOU_Y34scaffold00493g12 [Pyricularia oryzae Y34]KAH8839826.1 hypothetical protein MCOR01_009002 [Pyricularia oryzae]EHA55638.1 hypothetical protein MGG_07227 [Pyricularia oryzae 70-15]KAH9439686.1 hypothetical protein MCOR02_003228 [Pyricularia oryzae]KAI6266083.1 hypothetical protein MCOR27_011161 [Pyricularia oryzae]